jgi:hypothetical protein
MRNVWKTLTGKPEGKGSLGRSRRRWKDNVKEYFKILREDMDWIYVARD